MVSSFLAVWAVVASLLRQFVMHCFDSGTFNALALLSESENLVVSFWFIVKILSGLSALASSSITFTQLQIAPARMGVYGRWHDMFP
jgi:hypothetical protein